MSTSKISLWQSKPGRKLRVVFVDDSFWGYVDVPTAMQKAFENELRRSSGGTVSLYRPGSPYRDDVTPSLNQANLHVFMPKDATTISSTGEVTTQGRAVAVSRRTARTMNLDRDQKIAASSCTFSHWWAALPAVPATKSQTDWWAKPDRRASRYERLQRVWFDATRNYWFYRIEQEDHLTATLWENLCIFDLRLSIPRLFAAANLPAIEGVNDCCWSYEFEEKVSGHLKQIDVTLHLRDAHGDALLIVEAKRPGGPLKGSDHDPSYYLNLPSFEFASRRYMLYLVDQADLGAVRSRIVQTAAIPPGFLTWRQLGQLQISLCESLESPQAIRSLIAGLIRWQFGRHGFVLQHDSEYPDHTASLEDVLRANGDALGMPATARPDQAAQLATLQMTAALRMNIDRQLREFIAAAIQHQCCSLGVHPMVLAFDYLQNELSQVQIVPGMEGRQRTADRRRPLWKLPV